MKRYLDKLGIDFYTANIQEKKRAKTPESIRQGAKLSK